MSIQRQKSLERKWRILRNVTRKDFRLNPKDLANIKAIKTAKNFETDTEVIRFALDYCKSYVAPTREEAEDIIAKAKEQWKDTDLWACT